MDPWCLPLQNPLHAKMTNPVSLCKCMFFIWPDSNHDEGIHIPGGRLPGVRDMAQSVPVNVPMWSNPRAAKSVRDPVVIEVSFR